MVVLEEKLDDTKVIKCHSLRNMNGNEATEPAKLGISFHHHGITELKSFAWDRLLCGVGATSRSVIGQDAELRTLVL